MSAELFADAPPLAKDDALLVELYRRTALSVDELAYTPEFDRLYKQFTKRFPRRSRNDVFRRLLTLRKAARLPRLGHDVSIPSRDAALDSDLLGALVRRYAGGLGQRDRLPYSPQFERLWKEFNAVHRPPLDRNTVWRLVLRLAK